MTNRSLSLPQQPVSNALLYRQYQGGNEASRQSTAVPQDTAVPNKQTPCTIQTIRGKLLGLETEYGTSTVTYLMDLIADHGACGCGMWNGGVSDPTLKSLVQHITKTREVFGFRGMQW